MIGYIVLCGIIIIQLIIIAFLMDEWNKMDQENEVYYKKIRQEFDLKLKEYHDDIIARDEIIRGYRSMRGS